MLRKTRQTAEILVLNKGKENIVTQQTWNQSIQFVSPPTSTSRVFLLEDTGQRESDHCQSNRLFLLLCSLYLRASYTRARLIFQCPIIRREIPENPKLKTRRSNWRWMDGGGRRTDKVKICIDGESLEMFESSIQSWGWWCVSPARLFFSFQRSFKTLSTFTVLLLLLFGRLSHLIAFHS